MAKDEDFFERNAGKIGAAGLAVNALQNQKISEQQRKVAKLQAANAALQKEENDLKKKQLKELKKQQEKLDQKQKAESKRRDIQAELLDLSPQLAHHLESILTSNYQNKINRGKDIYEANCVLAYINSNKNVVEDINFHDYLFELKNKLAHCNQKFRKSHEIFTQYLENFEILLSEESNILSAIKLLFNGFQLHNKIEEKQIDDVGSLIDGLSKNKQHLSYIIDELKGYHDIFFNNNFGIGAPYIIFPLEEKQAKLLIDFLEKLKSEDFYQESVRERIEMLRSDYNSKELIHYFVNRKPYYKGTSIGTIEHQLSHFDKRKLRNEWIKTLKAEIGNYAKYVRQKLIEFCQEIDEENYESKLKNIANITGIQCNTDVLKSLNKKVENKKSLEANIKIFYWITFVFWIFTFFMLGSDSSEIWFILWCLTLVINLILYFAGKSPKNKGFNGKEISDTTHPYFSKIKEKLQSLEQRIEDRS